MTPFDFSKIPNVTLIVCPVDMRSGFDSLARYALSILQVVKRSLKAQKRSRHFS